MRAYLFYTKGEPSEEQSKLLAESLSKLQVDTVNLDADSTTGSREAELYDITTRPSVIVVRDDGAEVQRWTGNLPQPSDISYYVHTL